MRRIAIVGSFSTGKTTLATEVAPALDLPLLPEVAREIAALGFKLDKDATVETETLIFLRQWYAEMTHPEFVADRSMLDALAYAGWVLEHQERRKEFALWDACLDIATHHLRSNYSHVFYLPVEFPIVADGLRPMDPDFQTDIDKRIVGLLDSHSIPYETLTGTVQQRMEALLGSVTRR
ncbi:MAG TPA: ATP-binding protein [Actinomycetota bacterium]|nr:ATP-binding protein [Actinomycetota bacterium]